MYIMLNKKCDAGHKQNKNLPHDGVMVIEPCHSQGHGQGSSNNRGTISLPIHHVWSKKMMKLIDRETGIEVHKGNIITDYSGGQWILHGWDEPGYFDILGSVYVKKAEDDTPKAFEPRELKLIFKRSKI